ncbi:TPA: hypothetical protein ACQJXY_003358 [Citrobacter freundii]
MRLTNIQLIHAAHHAARYLPKASAEMVRELATRLDVSLVALREKAKQQDALAAPDSFAVISENIRIDDNRVIAKQTAKRTVAELKPNDLICVFGDWFRVRYLNYRDTETTVQLQRQTDKLSPFMDLTCMSFTVHSDLIVWIEAEVTP